MGFWRLLAVYRAVQSHNLLITCLQISPLSRVTVLLNLLFLTSGRVLKERDWLAFF